ncbi:MAG: ATP-binding protein [Pseudomonadota bacterium]
MIIDFTIKNFRSIKDEQVFSLHVDHPKSHLAAHVAFPGNGKIGVLRSAGIYGANASGKSNILLAIQALRYLTFVADLKDGDSIPCYEPYRLSDETKNAPIEFAIEFFIDGHRYSYAVSFNQFAILEETLDIFPSRQKANIFKRSSKDTWETISFGASYKGGTKRIPFFANSTYLSRAGNNAGSADIIRAVYNYFGRAIAYVGSKDEIYRADFLDDDELMRVAAKFLCHVDTGIVDVQKKSYQIEKDNEALADLPSKVRDLVIERSKRMFEFSHKTESGEHVYFTQMMESEGTQKLFSILPLLLKAFEHGHVLIMDELDNSFHPHIAELLIRLFNDPNINTNNAQLIFSTHNMHLMSSGNMRRDQIWFAQKNDGATSFYCLDDFDKSKLKSNSPFETWYDEGRFGALPNINYRALSKLLRPDGKENGCSDFDKPNSADDDRVLANA